MGPEGPGPDHGAGVERKQQSECLCAQSAIYVAGISQLRDKRTQRSSAQTKTLPKFLPAPSDPK